MAKRDSIAKNAVAAEGVIRGLGMWNPNEQEREQGLAAWRDLFVGTGVPVTEDTILAAQEVVLTVYFQLVNGLENHGLTDGPEVAYAATMLCSAMYGVANLLATEGDAATVRALLGTLDLDTEEP